MMTMPPPPAESVTKVLDICHVTPSQSHANDASLSLPLTFFDTYWLKLPPSDRIFFYRLPASSTTTPTAVFFHSVVLPRLKHYLSLALLQFLPLAGKLTWPSHSDVPLVTYTPGDGIPLTIAESTADFDRISGDGPLVAIESHPFIPKLSVSDSAASIIALQITLFPKQGFCIGVSAHHAVLDGKSSTMFIKAWAHLCKHCSSPIPNSIPKLPDELTPFMDRASVQDPEGMAIEYLKIWQREMKQRGDPEENPRSLAIFPEAGPFLNPDGKLIRATFGFSSEDMEKIRGNVLALFYENRASSDSPEFEATNYYLSDFLLCFSYILVCTAKAKGNGDGDKIVHFGFSADYRARLDPPLPANYLGNCVAGFHGVMKVGELVQDGGIACAAIKVGEVMRAVKRRDFGGAKEMLERYLKMDVGNGRGGGEGRVIGVGVVGSPRFGVYGADFGFGRPAKVEATSVDRSSAVSMAEGRDGGGGVEIGVAMQGREMELFRCAFADGLKAVGTVN